MPRGRLSNRHRIDNYRFHETCRENTTPNCDLQGGFNGRTPWSRFSMAETVYSLEQMFVSFEFLSFRLFYLSEVFLQKFLNSILKYIDTSFKIDSFRLRVR